MGNQLSLGDLEFKAEDFESLLILMGTTPIGKENGRVLADRANRILCEKLEKAPRVFIGPGSLVRFPSDYGERDGTETHAARLVCIEEIK